MSHLGSSTCGTMMSATSGIDRLVVVGASLAGLRAVESARALGFAGTIVLVGDEKHLPYDRPPLSKQLLNGADASFTFHGEEHYREELDVELRLGSPAVELDPWSKTVTTSQGPVAYDAAILATGASPRELPGLSHLPGVTSLRTLDDALRLRGALARGRRLLIVGAGFIGAEVASAARKRGLPVTIVEASQYPLERALGRDMGVALSLMHERNGVDIRMDTMIVKVNRNGDEITGVQLSDGTTVECNFILVSIGAVPNSAWLSASGIALASDGGVMCDTYLESSLLGVYAAGDVAHFPNRMTGREARIEHWTSANEQGAIAARNALGIERTPYETVPYVWSDWYDNRIQFVGRTSDKAPTIVSGSVEADKFIALYRDGPQVVGAVSVNEPGRIMKERRRIAQKASWAEALDAHRATA